MKALAKAVLRRLTYRLGYQNLDHLLLLLYSRLAKVDEFSIVQIGANDGQTFDPIHDFVVRNQARIRAVMLEPLPDFCERLVETYRDCPGVRVLQRAIHATEKTKTLYRVDPSKLEQLPPFARGIASFDPEYHAKSGTSRDVIVEELVSCITMAELIESCAISKIDLLCIDTEGYDSEILLSLDLDRIRPVIIMFEHGLRDRVMQSERFMDVIRLLNHHSYDVMVQDYDVIAHLRDGLGI